MVYSPGESICLGGILNEKRSLWLLLGLIALILINLVAWGKWNYDVTLSGHLSEDFVVNWVAARAFIFDGQNPYQPEVARTILTILNFGSDPILTHEAQFSSPIFSLIFLLPFALIDQLLVAQALWMSFQQVLIVIMVLITLKITTIKPGKIIFGLLIVSTIVSYHTILTISQGSTILLSGIFLLLSLLSIKHDREELGGVLLGLATIQLPYIMLPITLILLWTLLRGSKLVVFWFLGIIGLLTVVSLFIVRDWLDQYLKVLANYSIIYPASSPVTAFRAWLPGIGTTLGWGLSIISATIMLFEWWLALKAEFRWLVWTVSLTLVLSLWVGLPALPENLVLLIPPLVIVIGAYSERWKWSGNLIALVSLIIILVWEWWIVLNMSSTSSSIDSLALLFPMPLLCLIGLYWVRWLVTRPRKLLIDDMHAYENS